ncbi:MAG: tetratricopeptide repeat protein [Candidatus Binatia bacterium]
MKVASCILLLAVILIHFRSGAGAQVPDPGENFGNGYFHFSSGKYSQAKEYFERAVDSNYPLADYSLYYLALIAFHEADWDASRQWLSLLRQQYPQSIWFDAAELQRAKIDIAQGNHQKAIETLRALRAEKDLQSQISEEALYIEAHSHESQGNLVQAFSLFLELRQLTPQSQWAAAARKQMVRLRGRYPVLFGLHTVTAVSDEADRLAKERQYGEAEILYRKLLDQELEPPLRLRFLTKLAELYLSIRKRNEAIPLLEEIARDYAAGSEAPYALYRIGQILWNRNDNGQALQYFKKIMERYPGGPHVDKAFFGAADIYESQGKKDEAIALYNTIKKRFPKSPIHEDAMWRLGWLYYLAGDLRKASATFRTLALRGKEERYQTASLYWHARSTEKLGDSETASQIYQTIYKSDEQSYYQALASQRLANLGVPVWETRNSTSASAAEQEPAASAEVAFHLVRARELAARDLRALAIMELGQTSRFVDRQPHLRRLLMREYARNQAYSRSVAIANQLPHSFEERERYRFPLAYWDKIREKAREQDLDPYLILALIRQESLFDTRARSSAAALGLMQLIPSTAVRIAKQIGLRPPGREELFEPEINLTLGTRYLKDLLHRYSNNWHKAIAAYNAGENAVDRWEREIETEDSEEFVERIPYFETRQYVKLVLRNHRIYKRIYDQK